MRQIRVFHEKGKDAITIKKSIRIALIVICAIFLVIFAFSAYKILSTLNNYRKAENEHRQLANQVMTVSTPAASAAPAAPVDAPEASAAPLEVFPFSVDFETLKKTSRDSVGWIWSENTPINYPIVYGEDNVFYIEHLHNGEWNPNGAIFVDCREEPDFTERNTIIYGHNMNDGSMFASLRNYRNADYYPEHKCFYIATPDKYFRADIIAGLVTPADSFIYAWDFPEVEQFEAYIEQAREESTFKSDVQVTPDDLLVTLSTCTYEIADGRYVILAKLVECAPPEA